MFYWLRHPFSAFKSTFRKALLHNGAFIMNAANFTEQKSFILNKINFCEFSSLVFIEPYNNKLLTSSTFSAINAAKKFNEPISVVLLGDDSSDTCTDISKIKDVSEIIHIKNNVYNHLLSDITAERFHKLLDKSKYKRLIGSCTAKTKDIFPRIAALMDVQPITDVIEIIDNNTFIRPTYAGNILIKVRSKDNFKIILVRSTCFNSSIELNEVTENKTKYLEERDVKGSVNMKYVSTVASFSNKPQLSNAKVVVSGGRPFKSKEEFEKYLIPLCEKLNAAIGASRAAVDAGFVNNELQIGQTGKVVAPDLYIAVGISGAIQHVAGIKDSKVIVAINKDEDAPIFNTCDYGLVGDMFLIIPELTNKLNKQNIQ